VSIRAKMPYCCQVMGTVSKSPFRVLGGCNELRGTLQPAHDVLEVHSNESKNDILLAGTML